MVFYEVLTFDNWVVGYFLRLHFQDQVSSLYRNILRVEHRGVSIKATGCFMPAFFVEFLEIVSPVEIEFVGGLIPGEDLNVVVEEIPGHVAGIQVVAPRVESGRPEVHSQGLLLCHMLHGWLIAFEVANLMAID